MSADQLLSDSFLLAEHIQRSQFKPDFVIGIWRGGAPVGVYVQEYLEYVGIPTQHFAIRTRSYSDIDQQASVEIQGLEPLVNQIKPGDNILFVDDVFDTGRTIEAIFCELQLRTDLPGITNIQTCTVKVACPWYKPSRNVTSLTPDFYLHETADWLVFPHELIGLSKDEIKQCKGPQGQWLAQQTPKKSV
ncbi:MAG: hypothetical protein JKX83_00010 [Pseudomonadales bacterium]|nr:hypothetical protein [Pseudomonadales bacterium]